MARPTKNAKQALTHAAQRLAGVPAPTGKERRRAHNEAPKGSGIVDRAPVVNAQAISFSQYSRFNPLTNLSPAMLSQALDQFDLGYLYTCALLWQKMAKRDNVLSGVIPKRTKDVQRRDWAVITKEKSTEATRQQKVLDEFWRSITWVDSFDRNDRGKIGHLMGGIMTAHSYRYAAHHLIYQPRGGKLTMEAEYVPLQFFENTTGVLRHTLPTGNMTKGQDLDATNWVVCKGDGLMEPCSVAYMYKHLPLGDLLAFSEKFGIPFVWGEAPEGCQPGDDGWEQLLAGIAAVMSDNAGLFSSGTKLQSLAMPSVNELPFQPLIDYADRAMNRLFRGSDQQGMSRDNNSSGVSTAGVEQRIMVGDDCRFVTDALQAIEDRVAEYHGFDGRLAYIQVRGPMATGGYEDVAVDKFLITAGARLSVAGLMERYERTEAGPAETVAKDAFGTPAEGGGAAHGTGFNEREKDDMPYDVRTSMQASMQPLCAAIAGAMKGKGAADLVHALKALDWGHVTEEMMTNAGIAEDVMSAHQMQGALTAIGFDEAAAKDLIEEASKLTPES